MEIEFGFADLADFVRGVAGVAAHVQRGMAATFFCNVESLLMTIETEVLTLLSGGRLTQLVLVIALVRIVALDAIAHRWRMHGPFQGARVFFRVATEAERLRRGSDELDARDVLVHAHFVAAQTSRRYRRMHRFTLGFVFMTLEALGGIDILVERDGVLFRKARHCECQKNEQKNAQTQNTRY